MRFKSGFLLLALPCVLSLTFAAHPTRAAEVYWEPEVEVSAETNTNRDLRTTNEDSSENYAASFGAMIGIQSPRALSIVHPRIRLQNYPDRRDTKDAEGGVDFTSTFESQRTRFDMFASIQRSDVYNAELANPRFNELNPDTPTAPETGRIDGAGETRDSLRVAPTYRYQVSERFDLGLLGSYDKIDYSSNALTDRIDYDYARAGVYPTWSVSERMDVLLGAYATRYASSDDTRKTDSIGASAGLGYEWTPAHKAEFTVLAERTEIEDRVPALFQDTVTTIGGQVSLVRTTVLNDTRLIVGRLIQPTGGGGISESDHFQLQFDRRLSERLTLRSAALYTQNRALSDADTNSDSDYANGEVSLRWSATRTWYVFGGYRYIWQELDSAAQSAKNHGVFAGFGYRGLRSQQ